ncbi:Ig-like domain-containing protein, partial [Haladaptatus sp. W1]|uniref:Ig-like domain-containing protein n=1 Tax=Haladaptatus sp. W1 TaxID=1897478 RepID=UPI001112D183
MTSDAATNVTSEYTTYDATGLSAGTYTATLQVGDTAGNNVTTGTTFSIPADTTPPSVVKTTLADGATLPAGTTGVNINVTFADDQSGLDPSTARVVLDNSANVSGSWLVTGGDTITSGVGGLSDGTTHTFTAEMKDNDGNVQSKTITFSVGSSGGGGGGGGGGRPSATVKTMSGPDGTAIDILGGVKGQTAWADLSNLGTNGISFERYGIEFERRGSASVTVNAVTSPPKGTTELDGALGYFTVDKGYLMHSVVDTTRLQLSVSE